MVRRLLSKQAEHPWRVLDLRSFFRRLRGGVRAFLGGFLLVFHIRSMRDGLMACQGMVFLDRKKSFRAPPQDGKKILRVQMRNAGGNQDECMPKAEGHWSGGSTHVGGSKRGEKTTAQAAMAQVMRRAAKVITS